MTIETPQRLPTKGGTITFSFRVNASFLNDSVSTSKRKYHYPVTIPIDYNGRLDEFPDLRNRRIAIIGPDGSEFKGRLQYSHSSTGPYYQITISSSNFCDTARQFKLGEIINVTVNFEGNYVVVTLNAA